MNLSKKKANTIKKQYPHKSVEQLSQEHNLRPGIIYKHLGLQAELWTYRLDNLSGYLVCLLLLVAPFFVIPALSDLADLPQRVYIQNMTVVLLLLGTLRVTVNSEIKVHKNPVCLFVAAFLLWLSASFFWSNNGYKYFFSALHLASCGAVFFVINSVSQKNKWIDLILTSFLIATTGVVILGLGQQFFKLAWIPVISPPAATFVNPNVASHYLVIMLPIVLAFGFYRKNRLLRYGTWAVAALALVFLFYTRCRSAGIAVACAVIWTGLALAKRKFGAAFARKIFIPICIAVTVTAASCYMTGLFDKVLQNAGGSAIYRLTVWQNSFAMIKEKPLHGFGPGGFNMYYPAYTYKAVFDKAFDIKTQVRRAHNDYIQTAVELGIPGLLFFLTLLMLGLFMAWRLLSHEKDPRLHAVAIGFSAGIVSFMASAVFSFPLQRALPPLLIFSCLGILAAMYDRAVLHEKFFKFKVPKALGLTVIALFLISGSALAWFNWNNVVCDKFFNITMSNEKRGANRRALSAGLTANKYNPYRTDVLSAIGRAYIATGEVDKGIETLEKVVGMQPYFLNANFLLAIGHANAGNKDKALEALRKVLKIRPQFDKAQKIIALLKSRGKAKVNLK